jgi:hypothetical protein
MILTQRGNSNAWGFWTAELSKPDVSMSDGCRIVESASGIKPGIREEAGIERRQ